ncbi:MAG: hypothetical protein KJZ65_01695 [Phycisphaerales bacterium]|nr:hypothetical protein [Phycisphaerales bacterium]
MSGKMMSCNVGRAVLYPDLYCWYVLFATLDVIITTIVLDYYGMVEANAIAAGVIERYGFAGLVPFKFATVLLVLAICEYVGRVRPRTGLRVAQAAVGLSCAPIVVAALQLLTGPEVVVI